MGACEIRKNKRNSSHKILSGVNLFLPALFTYISIVVEFRCERSANTADEDF
jgi:hypothetical protein